MTNKEGTDPSISGRPGKVEELLKDLGTGLELERAASSSICAGESALVGLRNTSLASDRWERPDGEGGLEPNFQVFSAELSVHDDSADAVFGNP